jgi:hypothetical protein
MLSFTSILFNSINILQRRFDMWSQEAAHYLEITQCNLS